MAVPLVVYSDIANGIDTSYCVSSMYSSLFETTIGVGLARRSAIALDDRDAPPRPSCVDVEGGKGTKVMEENDCWVILTIVTEGVLHIDIPVEVVTGELTIEVVVADVVLLVEVDCTKLEVFGVLVEFVDVLDLRLELAVKVTVGETKVLLLLVETEPLVEAREIVDGLVVFKTTLLLLLLLFTGVEDTIEDPPTVPIASDETT